MFQEIENNRKALLTYIESAYHFSDENLLQQRSELLHQEGIITQRPYIESGAKYRLGKMFAELDIDKKIADVLTSLAKSKLLFNPPYLHQVEAIEKILSSRKNIIVTTGTGSGKTECFLLPILGRLIEEAPKPSFKQRAVRTLLLYPMNALVNDQLGRLRVLFGSKTCFDFFKKTTGRPIKFGRYTGRTLFPGLLPNPNDSNFSSKMQQKLAGLSFYYKIADRALKNQDEKEQKKASDVIQQLYKKGKFPVKHSATGNPAQGFCDWFGQSGGRWLQNGKLARTIERADDSELLVRHEMQNTPPDILVTNYSMLEYMLLRPIERNIFSITKSFYQENPDERFILVLDESHLYNGEQGTEIAMLIRRLKQRLDLRPDQFQVICTSASFGDKEPARKFAAELSGVPLDSIVAITSDDKKVAHTPSGAGTKQDAEWLSNQSREDVEKISGQLNNLPVFGRLVNLTSLAKNESDELTLRNEEAAQELEALAKKLFEDVDEDLAKTATDKLIELASAAKDADGHPLFAARVHRFYRGLSGLWASCESIDGSLVGKLYASSRRYSEDGHRVFELHSCKKCGTPYFYAWTDDIEEPRYLWSEDVGQVDGANGIVKPIQILLKDPNDFDTCRELRMNIFNGMLLSEEKSRNTRSVWIPELKESKKTKKENINRLFTNCPICKAKGQNIGNHRTKGDTPFQHLITSQLLEQPERPESDKPLKGRKVLIFSDGRQAASRLAGHLTTDSMRDALRPLMLDGFQYLKEHFKDEETQSLRYAYAAILAGAYNQGITLEPLQKYGENFYSHNSKVRDNLKRGNITWSKFQKNVESFEQIPESILSAIYDILINDISGLHAIGLARIVPDWSELDGDDRWDDLPVPNDVEEAEKEEWKRNLLDLWIQLMFDERAVFMKGTPSTWIDNDEKRYPKRYKDRFIDVFKFILGEKQFVDNNFSDAKNRPATWFKYLRDVWGHSNVTSNGLFVDCSKLMINEVNVVWRRCNICTRIFPFNLLTKNNCPFCSSENSVKEIQLSDMLPLKRIQLYRQQTERMRNENCETHWKPYPFIAAEHSAAVGTLAPDSDDAWTLSEKYEIRFQDIEIPDDNTPSIPVDVLSCTTTMEVGIDIGSLTAVAMRNVPPNRSNYQQRAGRAGRRGSSLSIINTYADNDSHNQRYFADPAAMISSPVRTPILNIDNEEIVLRHCFALIFSLFQQQRIKDERDQNIFASLGKTVDFRNGNVNEFSYRGLEQWLKDEKEQVQSALRMILDGNKAFDNGWIQEVPKKLLKRLQKHHLDFIGSQVVEEESEIFGSESEVETENTPLDVTKLLDRLFDKSLLPSYAFPRDVVSMHVFDIEESKRKRRAVLQYAPQYGLTQALSSYAPGKEVYIDGRRFYSFALWSLNNEKDAEEMWEKRKLYYECRCGHVELHELSEGTEGEMIMCSGCNRNMLGPARIWIIPHGFAQPQDIREQLPEEEVPDNSFATHAKLTADFDGQEPFFNDEHFRFWHGKKELLLTNRGVNNFANPSTDDLTDREQNNATNQAPNHEKYSGFNYCTSCGRIEPVNWHSDKSFAFKGHQKPFPVFNHEKENCFKPHTERVVLGTKFNSDVVLIRLNFGGGICLKPGSHLARIALRTLVTAMVQTAIHDLEIEPNNIGGEFRPVPTTDWKRIGYEADVFLYDNIADGAGFVREAVKEPTQFLENVLQRLESCDCDHACPRCLQTYQNRFIHSDLDRQTAAGLLRYLLSGEEPKLAEKTENILLKILDEDLKDKKIETELQDGFIQVGNTLLFVSHSLMEHKPASERTAELVNRYKEKWIFIPHLLIDRALPAATKRVLENF